MGIVAVSGLVTTLLNIVDPISIPKILGIMAFHALAFIAGFIWVYSTIPTSNSSDLSFFKVKTSSQPELIEKETKKWEIMKEISRLSGIWLLKKA